MNKLPRVKTEAMDATVSPEGLLAFLSKSEVEKLLDTSQSGLYTLFRNCALAVLNNGSYLDDGKKLLELFPDFDIQIVQSSIIVHE